MSGNEATFWVSIIALAIACIGYAVTATWQLGRVEGRCHEKSRSGIDGLRKEQESDAKARDAVTASAFMEMRQSMKEMNERHFALDREAIRKVDLAAFETRLNGTLAAHETRLTSLIAKLEQRFDNWGEHLRKG